jgi:hypothetical protein
MTIIDEDTQYTIGVVRGPSDPRKPGSGVTEDQRAQRGTIEVEQHSEPKRTSGPKIVVELEAPPARLAPPARGNTLVIVVYVLATAALAVSIYTRWFA